VAVARGVNGQGVGTACTAATNRSQVPVPSKSGDAVSTPLQQPQPHPVPIPEHDAVNHLSMVTESTAAQRRGPGINGSVRAHACHWSRTPRHRPRLADQPSPGWESRPSRNKLGFSRPRGPTPLRRDARAGGTSQRLVIRIDLSAGVPRHHHRAQAKRPSRTRTCSRRSRLRPLRPPQVVPFGRSECPRRSGRATRSGHRHEASQRCRS
jgi:hypothetical protein